MSSNDIASNNDFHGCSDLSKQFKALQRALAIELGENHRFREEIRKFLRQK